MAIHPSISLFDPLDRERGEPDPPNGQPILKQTLRRKSKAGKLSAEGRGTRRSAGVSQERIERGKGRCSLSITRIQWKNAGDGKGRRNLSPGPKTGEAFVVACSPFFLFCPVSKSGKSALAAPTPAARGRLYEATPGDETRETSDK